MSRSRPPRPARQQTPAEGAGRGGSSGRDSAEGGGADPRTVVLAPLPIRSAGERIADRVVTAIALGQFVPGQRLPSERELAAMLEVSRTTVREALQRLSASGHLVIRRGRGGGAFVTDRWTVDSEEMVRRTLQPQWQHLEALLDMRQLVEQQIARTAAERRRPEDVRAIKAALRAYEQAGDDRESSRAADAAVHSAIAGATGNRLLVELSGRLRHDISLGFEAEPYSQHIRARALEQHPRLATAVIEGAPEQAAAHAAEHFRLTEQTLRALHARAAPQPPQPAVPGHTDASRPGSEPRT